METSSVAFNPSLDYVNQDYSNQDISLLNEYEIVRNFGADQDVVEYYVYSADNTLIAANYNFKNYNTQETSEDSNLYDTIYLDPVEDVKSAGYDVIGNLVLIDLQYIPRPSFNLEVKSLIQYE